MSFGGIPDCELIYHIWQYNGSIYGPFGAESMHTFFAEGKLQFPTRIQINETRKGKDNLLDYFGTVYDLQNIFGPHNIFPKRLSQFQGKWSLPEILPNASLLKLDPPLFVQPLTAQPRRSSYCPFITGIEGEIADEHILPLSTLLDMARRILMDYSNLKFDEKHNFFALLTEVFSPRMCETCDRMIEDQHSFMMHALSLIHLEKAVMKNNKTFTIDFDYLPIRKMLDAVKKYTFEVKASRIQNKVQERSQETPLSHWNQNWVCAEFSSGVPISQQ